MQKDLNFDILDENGDANLENGEAVSAAKIVIRSLKTPSPGKQITLEDSMKRYWIIKKITRAAGNPDLTSDDIVFIKEAIAPVLFPYVTGQICDFLDS